MDWRQFLSFVRTSNLKRIIKWYMCLCAAGALMILIYEVNSLQYPFSDHFTKVIEINRHKEEFRRNDKDYNITENETKTTAPITIKTLKAIGDNIQSIFLRIVRKQIIFLSGREDGQIYLNTTSEHFLKLCRHPELFTNGSENGAPTIGQYYCDVLNQCWRESKEPRHTNHTNLCPCIPENLVGKVSTNITESNLNGIRTQKSTLASLQPGGEWRPLGEEWRPLGGEWRPLGGEWRPPGGCTPRRRVAVIIPYRDRERHLRAFLLHTHPILQRQLIHYRIFVVEQNLPYVFNKASLMNIGYVEAKKVFDMDCVLFHDVDTLIERDDNMVICGDQPIHFAAYSDRHGYRMRKDLLGSAVLMSTQIFEHVNGFTNLCYGWGGEDNDLRNRLMGKMYDIYRGPLDLARCTIFNHTRDVLFEQHHTKNLHKLLGQMKRYKHWHKVDGLNTVQYTVLKYVNTSLYTHLLVDLHKIVLPKNIPSSLQRLVSDYTQVGFSAKPLSYTIIKGECILNGTVQKERHFVSRITCQYLCDTDYRCHFIEYHPSMDKQTDSYCVLLDTCSLQLTDSSCEIYAKLK